MNQSKIKKTKSIHYNKDRSLLDRKDTNKSDKEEKIHHKEIDLQNGNANIMT